MFVVAAAGCWLLLAAFDFYYSLEYWYQYRYLLLLCPQPNANASTSILHSTGYKIKGMELVGLKDNTIEESNNYNTCTQRQALSEKKSVRRKQQRRRPIKNQLLHLSPWFIMVLFITASFVLIFLIFLNFTSPTQARDYLYANPKALDDENAKEDNNGHDDTWPIIDYVKPKKKPLETESQYKKRWMNPSFLSDKYDKPRSVEFYAPWYVVCHLFN